MSSSTRGSFQYHQGELFCDDLSLASLAERFGTPAYIYSQSTILHNYERLRGMLAHAEAAGIPRRNLIVDVDALRLM